MGRSFSKALRRPTALTSQDAEHVICCMDLGDAWESNCYKEWILSSGSSRCLTNFIIPILLLCSFSNEKGWLSQTQRWWLIRSVGRPAPTESCTLFWHNTWTWTMFEGKKWHMSSVQQPQVGCFIIEDYDTVLPTYIGECFFLAKIRIPMISMRS